MRLVIGLAAAALALPTSVHAAEWREAETAHFRIMSSGDEKSLVRFAERLEQFHTLLRMATGANEQDRRIVKVRVFLVSSIGDVARLYGKPNSTVAGFYVAREDGAIAVVPRSTDDGEFTGQVVLFHEYAHHFMLQYTPVAYPAWYVEGFAEISATASFERKGAITYGKPANHRQYELDWNNRYPAARLIDGGYIADARKGRSWSYADAWLVTHYLTFGETRRGQLRTYLNAINAGTPMAEAAKVFGDLAALQREVSIYHAGRSFPYRAVPLPEGAAGEIKVRMVGVDEAALVEQQIEIGRRLRLPQKTDDDSAEDNGDGKKAERSEQDFETRLAAAKAERDIWLTRLDAQAAQNPASPYGWRLVADARCQSEQPKECLAAADRVLAINPADGRGLVRRAQALMTLAADLPADERKARVAEARALAARAMNANPDDPMAKLIFYRSYGAEGRAAPPVGLAALAEAQILVPQMSDVRLALAGELLRRGTVAELLEARKLLRPLAHNPHGRSAAAAARKLIERIDDRLNSMAQPATE